MLNKRHYSSNTFLRISGQLLNLNEFILFDGQIVVYSVLFLFVNFSNANKIFFPKYYLKISRRTIRVCFFSYILSNTSQRILLTLGNAELFRHKHMS